MYSGWEIHYKLPSSKGGTRDWSNMTALLKMRVQLCYRFTSEVNIEIDEFVFL